MAVPRLMYSIRVSSAEFLLLEYYRVHYGPLSAGDLLPEITPGLMLVNPVVGAPLTIVVRVELFEDGTKEPFRS